MSIETSAELQTLHKKLSNALAQFRAGENGGRVGARIALLAITDYFDNDPEARSKGYMIPLVALSNAMGGLDNNNVLPILKPVPRHGHAPSTMWNATMQALAIHTGDCLTELGIPNADDVVARKMIKGGFGKRRTGSRKIKNIQILDAQTIDGWRNKSKDEPDSALGMSLALLRNHPQARNFADLSKHEASNLLLSTLTQLLHDVRATDIR